MKFFAGNHRIMCDPSIKEFKRKLLCAWKLDISSKVRKFLIRGK